MARKVMRDDGEAVVQVEPVRVGAVEANSRVKVELVAAESLPLLHEPVEQASS
jgi:hypothetical protein